MRNSNRILSACATQTALELLGLSLTPPRSTHCPYSSRLAPMVPLFSSSCFPTATFFFPLFCSTFLSYLFLLPFQQFLSFLHRPTHPYSYQHPKPLSLQPPQTTSTLATLPTLKTSTLTRSQPLTGSKTNFWVVSNLFRFLAFLGYRTPN